MASGAHGGSGRRHAAWATSRRRPPRRGAGQPGRLGWGRPHPSESTPGSGRDRSVGGLPHGHLHRDHLGGGLVVGVAPGGHPHLDLARLLLGVLLHRYLAGLLRGLDEKRNTAGEALVPDELEGANAALVPAGEPVIRDLMYTVRGTQVMMDSDLAMLYGVETKALNRAVNRNIKRFPERYRFQLTAEEFGFLRSQIVTSNRRAEVAAGTCPSRSRNRARPCPHRSSGTTSPSR